MQKLPDHILERAKSRNLDETTLIALAKGYKSLRAFRDLFLDAQLYREFKPLHDPILNTLDDRLIQRVELVAFRGFGKSTLLRSYAIKEILYGVYNHIVWIGSSQETAIEQTETIKKTLIESDRIRKIFGVLQSKKWAETDWVLSNGTKILPRGAGQKIRGRSHGFSDGHGSVVVTRPQLVICDDIENDENVLSEVQRDKLSTWFAAAVMNSLQTDFPWRVILSGTLLHQGSLIKEKMDSSSWTTISIPGCDSGFKSLWPEWKTDEELAIMVAEHRAEGKLATFAMEIMNEVVPVDGSGFQEKWFKRYDESTFKVEPNMVTAIIIDPAKTHKTGSCKTAILVATFEMETNKIWFRHLENDTMTVPELYDRTVQLARHYKAQAIAPEVSGLDDFIINPLQNIIAINALQVILIELRTGRLSKDDRIAGLLPFYKNGSIYHDDSCVDLEAQLISWPRSRFKDAMDCAAYVPKLMEEYEMYFEELIDETLDDDYRDELYSAQLRHGVI